MNILVSVILDKTLTDLSVFRILFTLTSNNQNLFYILDIYKPVFCSIFFRRRGYRLR